MGIVSSAARRRAETRAFLGETTFSNPSEWLYRAFGISSADSTVSHDEALKITAFLCCVKIIAEDVASLPFMVMKRLNEGSRKKGVDTDHPLYPVIHDEANPEMSAMSMREAITIQAAWTGTGYGQLIHDSRGNVAQIWPLYSHRMRLERDRRTDQLRYFYSPSDGRPEVPLLPSDLLVVPGLTMNGLTGVDIVTQAGRALYLARAAEVYAQKFFDRHSTPSGYISVPGEIDDHGKELSESWTARTAGEGGIHGTPVLENNFEFRAIPLPDNRNAQMTETRKEQDLHVIRLFRMPPQKIGNYDKATYNNFEQSQIEYVSQALRVWLVRMEQAVNRCCLTADQRRIWFTEHSIEGLLRGDIKTRYDSYAVGINWGWLYADEVRELENMNPLPDGQGTLVLVPSNMVPVRQLIEQMERPTEQDLTPPDLTPQPPLPQGEEEEREPGVDVTPDGGSEDGGTASTQTRTRQAAIIKRTITSRERLVLAYGALLKRDAARVLRREHDEIRKASRKYLEREDLPSMVAWVLEFYAAPPEFVSITMEPVVDSLFRALAWDIAEDEGLVVDETLLQGEVAALLVGYCEAHTEGSRVGVMTLLNSITEGHAGALDAWLSKQEESRPMEIATTLAATVAQRAWGWLHPERVN